jgi:uncharacterized protein Smg (DUF494 family)
MLTRVEFITDNFLKQHVPSPQLELSKIYETLKTDSTRTTFFGNATSLDQAYIQFYLTFLSAQYFVQGENDSRFCAELFYPKSLVGTSEKPIFPEQHDFDLSVVSHVILEELSFALCYRDDNGKLRGVSISTATNDNLDTNFIISVSEDLQVPADHRKETLFTLLPESVNPAHPYSVYKQENIDKATTHQYQTYQRFVDDVKAQLNSETLFSLLHPIFSNKNKLAIDYMRFLADERNCLITPEIIPYIRLLGEIYKNDLPTSCSKPLQNALIKLLDSNPTRRYRPKQLYPFNAIKVFVDTFDSKIRDNLNSYARLKSHVQATNTLFLGMSATDVANFNRYDEELDSLKKNTKPLRLEKIKQHISEHLKTCKEKNDNAFYLLDIVRKSYLIEFTEPDEDSPLAGVYYDTLMTVHNMLLNDKDPMPFLNSITNDYNSLVMGKTLNLQEFKTLFAKFFDNKDDMPNDLYKHNGMCLLDIYINNPEVIDMEIGGLLYLARHHIMTLDNREDINKHIITLDNIKQGLLSTSKTIPNIFTYYNNLEEQLKELPIPSDKVEASMAILTFDAIAKLMKDKYPIYLFKDVLSSKELSFEDRVTITKSANLILQFLRFGNKNLNDQLDSFVKMANALNDDKFKPFITNAAAFIAFTANDISSIDDNEPIKALIQEVNKAFIVRLGKCKNIDETKALVEKYDAFIKKCLAYHQDKDNLKLEEVRTDFNGLQLDSHQTAINDAFQKIVLETISRFFEPLKDFLNSQNNPIYRQYILESYQNKETKHAVTLDSNASDTNQESVRFITERLKNDLRFLEKALNKAIASNVENMDDLKFRICLMKLALLSDALPGLAGEKTLKQELLNSINGALQTVDNKPESKSFIVEHISPLLDLIAQDEIKISDLPKYKEEHIKANLALHDRNKFGADFAHHIAGIESNILNAQVKNLPKYKIDIYYNKYTEKLEQLTYLIRDMHIKGDPDYTKAQAVFTTFLSAKGNPIDIRTFKNRNLRELCLEIALEAKLVGLRIIADSPQELKNIDRLMREYTLKMLKANQRNLSVDDLLNQDTPWLELSGNPHDTTAILNVFTKLNTINPPLTAIMYRELTLNLLRLAIPALDMTLSDTDTNLPINQRLRRELYPLLQAFEKEIHKLKPGSDAHKQAIKAYLNIADDYQKLNDVKHIDNYNELTKKLANHVKQIRSHTKSNKRTQTAFNQVESSYRLNENTHIDLFDTKNVEFSAINFKDLSKTNHPIARFLLAQELQQLLAKIPKPTEPIKLSDITFVYGMEELAKRVVSLHAGNSNDYSIMRGYFHELLDAHKNTTSLVETEYRMDDAQTSDDETSSQASSSGYQTSDDDFAVTPKGYLGTLENILENSRSTMMRANTSLIYAKNHYLLSMLYLDAKFPDSLQGDNALLQVHNFMKLHLAEMIEEDSQITNVKKHLLSAPWESLWNNPHDPIVLGKILDIIRANQETFKPDEYEGLTKNLLLCYIKQPKPEWIKALNQNANLEAEDLNKPYALRKKLETAGQSLDKTIAQNRAQETQHRRLQKELYPLLADLALKVVSLKNSPEKQKELLDIYVQLAKQYEMLENNQLDINNWRNQVNGILYPNQAKQSIIKDDGDLLVIDDSAQTNHTSSQTDTHRGIRGYFKAIVEWFESFVPDKVTSVTGKPSQAGIFKTDTRKKLDAIDAVVNPTKPKGAA